MRRTAILMTASIVGLTLWAGAPGYSQTASTHSAAERRKALEQHQIEERTRIEQSNQKLESSIQARADKRRSCTKEAKQQRLSVFKRRRFVRECMAR